MKIVRTNATVRAELEPPRRAGASIGLVPTMGALHEGHTALLDAARERCDVVVISLFVNPAQFRPGEDLDAYPRDEPRDAELAEAAGADLLFAPAVEDLYPAGFATSVMVAGGLTNVLDGDPARRGPDHFRGVATVVAKLLNVVGPEVAFFGQKDAQQALVVKRMVRDLEFPTEIEVIATVREPDGLAISSRNRYLDRAERQRASALHRGLRAAEAAAAEGERRVEALLAVAGAELAAAGIEPEYLEARGAEDLEEVAQLNGRPVVIAVAARVGPARLIDNVVISGEAGSGDALD